MATSNGRSKRHPIFYMDDGSVIFEVSNLWYKWVNLDLPHMHLAARETNRNFVLPPSVSACHVIWFF
jgi:hypothetical protein